MGKIQKIKKQKKLEREQEFFIKKKKKKRILKLGIALVAVVLIVVAFNLFSGDKESQNNETIMPEETITKEKVAVLETNLGVIKLKLFKDAAPVTVANFERLAGEGFYDGVKFHRVIKDFMLQTGDPNSKDDDWSNDGEGGPGYSFEDEINDYKLIKGRLAMANSGPDTNGSQFFIVTAESTPWLDGAHTVFGEVILGMDIVDQIENVSTNENDHPLTDVVMSKVYVIEE